MTFLLTTRMFKCGNSQSLYDYSNVILRAMHLYLYNYFLQILKQTSMEYFIHI